MGKVQTVDWTTGLDYWTSYQQQCRELPATMPWHRVMRGTEVTEADGLKVPVTTCVVGYVI